MIAYDYPLLGMFWTMMIFFLWIAWIWIVIKTVVDVFRSDDLGGFAKAFWLLFIILVPWLGVLIYLIARGGGMAQRDMAQAQAQQEAFASYVKQTAGTSGGSADELAKLAQLKDSGVITDAEFAAQKAKLLA